VKASKASSRWARRGHESLLSRMVPGSDNTQARHAGHATSDGAQQGHTVRCVVVRQAHADFPRRCVRH
jgi:hypothetical protein